jgi:hypothetical protein
MVAFCACWQRRPSRIPISRQELERTTDICYSDLEMGNEEVQSYEACLTDGTTGKFIGTTAKFTAEWKIVSLRPDLWLDGYIKSRFSTYRKR